MGHSRGMVDVGSKGITVRTARASGTIRLGFEALRAVTSNACPKGDVITTARIGAIQAAKQTPALIPLCHPVLIEAVSVDFEIHELEESITVTVTVVSSGKTGVEMEALAAASVACLTIYDMLKYIGKGMVIGPIMLLSKSGGESGDYQRKD